MTDILHVKKRTEHGTRHARRLRAAGLTPAVLYGHGEETVSLSLNSDELHRHLRHRARVYELEGDATGGAFLNDVQYDPMGAEILHIDLTRVSAHELVDVTLSVHLRGEAPGTHHGGMIEQPTHEVEINCPVAQIPEELVVNLLHLELGQSITAGDIPLPEGATLITSADAVIVSCYLPTAAPEVEAVAAAEGEPELVGRKPAEEAESES